MSTWAIRIGAVALLAACGEEPVRSAPGPEAAPPYPFEVAGQVDPRIGTGGEGNTFPGAVAPWGMVSVSPHNAYVTPQEFLLEGLPLAPSGYAAGRPQIFGFGLTQLSGVGCPDLGLPALMPSLGPVRARFGPDGRPRDGSRYRGELAWPGYYAVELEESGITVEATAGVRVGVLRLRYPDRPGGDANLLVDVGHGLSWNAPLGKVRVVSERELEGSSEAGLFCARSNRQKIHFVLRVLEGASVAVESGTWQGEAVSSAREATGEAGGFLRFRAEAGRPIEVAVGVSYVSVEGARRNLEAELGARGFESLRAETFAAWERTLSRVRVEGGSASARRIFYTALYHLLIHPGRFGDLDGTHPVMGGGGTAIARDHERHTVFSLWDTYRNLHPFLTLVYPERQLELLRSLAAIAREGGALPKWELAGYEVQMMVGDPAIAVVADSYRKGIVDFDLAGLYQTMRAGALQTSAPLHRPGNASYQVLGYIPIEEASEVWGPVSTTLEYAYADWALAELATALGEQDDAALFRARAGAYRLLLDPKSGLLRPKRKDGSWLEPFDPDALEGSRAHARSGGPGFVEGTAWHYAFAVPHDIPGLIAAHGGPAVFGARLRSLFESGRFVLWNEPDIAAPYLFTYLPGEAWRTQHEVRDAIHHRFGAGPDGLPGNDDAGTLSAWLVFSALGLYPDCPGSTRYRLGSPIFDWVELALHPDFHTGSRFVIEAPGAELRYLAGAFLDGRPLATPTLEHAEIVAGGSLRLVRSEHPTSLW